MNEREFDHLLFTRFNIKFPNSSNDVNDIEWLDKRFTLFEKYCLPSVLAQTNQNFTWNILCDEFLPEKFKKIMLQLENDFPIIKAHFFRVDAIEKIPETVRSIARSQIRGKYLITSRLDSDDMIYKGYINDVQSLFDYQNDRLLNFLNGFHFSEKHNLFTVVENYQANPFISYIEKVENEIKTIFLGKPHNLLKDYPGIQNYRDRGYWCTVIHDNNIINALNGRPTLDHGILEYFPSLTHEKNLVSVISFFKLSLAHSIGKLKKRVKSTLSNI